MNQLDKTIKQKKVLGWLAFIGFAVILPAIITWQACSYIASVNAEGRLRQYQIEANEILERLRVSADSGMYLCNRINDVFNESGSPEELARNISVLDFELDNGLEYLVWQPDGNIATSTFAWREIKADWSLAFFSLFDISQNHREKISDDDTANLRRIFGPQFFPETHVNCYSGRNIKPNFGDSSMQIAPSWVRAGKRFGLIVFLNEELLKGIAGIDFQISRINNNSDLRLAALINGHFVADPELKKFAPEIASISQNFINPEKLGDVYIFKSILKTDTFGFCFLPVDKVEKLQWSMSGKIILLLLIIIGLLIVLQSYRSVFCGQKVNLSIRRQLIILFLVSNSLSLIILALLGFDYLQQYRLFLQTDTFSRGMTYLQSIDEMFVSEFSTQLRRMNKSLEQMKIDLKSQKPNRAVVENFLAMQRPKPFRMFLIGSHTPYISSELGIMKDGKFIEEINMDWARYKSMQTLVESMGKLGSYYLSLLNRETLSQGIMTQVELIAESLGQLRPIEMFQEFFAATGSFWQWGMGARSYPAFISVLNVYDPAVADYVFLYLWTSAYLQHTYIDKAFADMNRNPLGLKIMAVDEDFRYSFPPELLKNKQLRLYSSKLREKTGTEIDYCDWDDEKHLLMGLKCSSLNTIRLLGLFPIEEIENKIRQKLYMFLVLALISFFVSLALGLFVSRSILLPLAELQKGVIALKKRDFAYRLPDLGQDEFGNLARIFNTTLVDLEELHVASVVQEKLADRMLQVHVQGSLRLFAGSHSVQKLGGDYFDFFPADEQRLCIALGDVAGSGVSVSLQIAFIKACLLQLKHLQLQPDTLLNRLYELITASSAQGQRKFVTFQYCIIDGSNSQISIANAGHCFPILVNASSGQIKVIEMPSTPLGSGKMPRIFSAALTLRAEEALVIYSGGLYRNGDIGFERMCNVLLRSYDACPLQYHDNVMKSIFSIAPQADCTDDLSLIIITPQNPSGDSLPSLPL